MLQVEVEHLAGEHEVKVIVDTKALVAAGKMRADCADVLFFRTDADATADPIKYFLDAFPGCDAENTGFWIPAQAPGSFEVSSNHSLFISIS